MSEKLVEMGAVLDKIAREMKDHKDTRPTTRQETARVQESRGVESKATPMEIEYAMARPV